ncbi:unnamed protein product [Closterium sp. NIES-53]
MAPTPSKPLAQLLWREWLPTGRSTRRTTRLSTSRLHTTWRKEERRGGGGGESFGSDLQRHPHPFRRLHRHHLRPRHPLQHPCPSCSCRRSASH